MQVVVPKSASLCTAPQPVYESQPLSRDSLTNFPCPSELEVADYNTNVDVVSSEEPEEGSEKDKRAGS